MRIACTLVQGVDLLDIHLTETLSLPQFARSWATYFLDCRSSVLEKNAMGLGKNETNVCEGKNRTEASTVFCEKLLSIMINDCYDFA